MNQHQKAALFQEFAKLAEEEGFKEKAMRGFVAARPYAAAAAKAGLPAALAGKLLFESASAPGRAAHAGRTFGLIGAGLGVGNEALKAWARRHKRKKLGKEILKEGGVEFEVPAAQYKMRKVAAMAADLRRTGIGGVRRPPFATEDSKQHAFGALTNAQKPGKFFGASQARHLRAPGPSISQVSPLPTG